MMIYDKKSGFSFFKLTKRFINLGFRVLAVLVIGLILTNHYVLNRYKNKIVSDVKDIPDVDCIMVLGAGVWSGERPSYMLQERLDTGIELYQAQVTDRLLMSGDHGRINYDEVNVMKDYAESAGIAGEYIFMDHAGFSTYESMARAQKVFEVKSMVIVTQAYHLHRAVYIANQLGIDAYGVQAYTWPYKNQWMRELREALARTKDFFYTALEVKPTYLGDTIPISGSGTLTDDQ